MSEFIISKIIENSNLEIIKDTGEVLVDKSATGRE